jgi:fatty acid/phospholipid biosynthesis enzyme
MADSKVIYSKAKTVAAAIGGTLTALSVALTVVQLALGDGNIDAGEVGTLASAAVTLVGTVYAVWRTENKVLRGTPSTNKYDY